VALVQGSRQGCSAPGEGQHPGGIQARMPEAWASRQAAPALGSQPHHVSAGALVAGADSAPGRQQGGVGQVQGQEQQQASRSGGGAEPTAQGDHPFSASVDA
jgi:hypothetical protein